MRGPVSIRSAASVTYGLWCLETRMRKPTNSALETVSRMRWPRPTVSSCCAQSGTRDVVSLLGKVLDKLSVDKLECWVWDQVYTQNALPVLTLTMCMVIDIVFPVNEKKMSPELLCWSAGCESSGSAWGGEASCGFAVRSFTEVGLPYSSNVASEVAARNL